MIYYPTNVVSMSYNVIQSITFIIATKLHS